LLDIVNSHKIMMWCTTYTAFKKLHLISSDTFSVSPIFIHHTLLGDVKFQGTSACIILSIT